MDTDSVREHARGHADAMVAGDLKRAGSDLTAEARASAPAVMSALPNPITSADIESVEDFGDQAIALIRYRGQESEVVVESRWGDGDGRPQIVDLKVV